MTVAPHLITAIDAHTSCASLCRLLSAVFVHQPYPSPSSSLPSCPLHPSPLLPVFSLAKKSFTGYLRSLQLLPGKSQQDISKLPLDAFAISLGLGMTPEAPTAPQGEEERGEVREKKNVNR